MHRDENGGSMADIMTRRTSDSGFGKLVYSWPVIVGVFLVLISAGGYIETIHVQDKHLDKIDGWIAAHEKTDVDNAKIIVHLTDLEDSQDRRVSLMEDSFKQLLSMRMVDQANEKDKRRR